MTTKTTAKWDQFCAHCSRPIAECKAEGLHGMIRDRCALATKQLRAERETK